MNFITIFIGISGTLWMFVFSWHVGKKNVRVPHIFLWKEFAQKESGKKHFQLSWWLLLSLLIYWLLLIAWSKWNFPIIKTIIVLDASASMQTKSSPSFPKIKTVWEQACSIVENIAEIQGLESEVNMIVYPNGKFSGTFLEAKKWLKTQQPNYISSNLSKFLENFAQSHSISQKIFVLSDGTEKIPNLPNIFPIYCGQESSNNVGIVDFSIVKKSFPLKTAEQESSLQNQLELKISIQNFSSHPILGSITIFADQQQISNVEILLEAQQFYQFCQDYNFEQNKIISVLWQPSDNFQIDNQVWAIKGEIETLGFSEDIPNIFQQMPFFINGLQKADFQKANFKLQKIPNIQAYILTSKKSSISVEKFHHDISFIDMPKYIGCGDPLMKAVYPELWEIPFAYSLPFSKDYFSEFKGLLTTPQGAILAYSPTCLYIGFDPTATQWTRLPSYPIFWENIWNFFSPNRSKFFFNLPSLKFPTPGIYEKTAINFLSPQESHNIGKNNISQDIKKILAASPASFEKELPIKYRNACIIIALLGMLFLWKRT